MRNNFDIFIEKGVHDKHQIVQIALGRFHSVLLTDKGKVFTCGSSSMGRLGHGDEGENEKVPKVVASLLREGGGGGGQQQRESRFIHRIGFPKEGGAAAAAAAQCDEN